MSAILILIVFALWGALLFSVGYYGTFFLNSRSIRLGVGIIATALLITLPLWDELSGAAEFEEICRTNAVFKIAPDANGRRFDLKYEQSPSRPLQGHSRPIEEATITYTDVATNEVVAIGKAYFAKGGMLVKRRLIANSGGGDGAFIGRPQCFPAGDERAKVQAITNKLVN